MAGIAFENFYYRLVQLPAASFKLGISGDKCPVLVTSEGELIRITKSMSMHVEIEEHIATAFVNIPTKWYTSLSRHTCTSVSL
jgi:hypothetical protein